MCDYAILYDLCDFYVIYLIVILWFLGDLYMTQKSQFSFISVLIYKDITEEFLNLLIISGFMLNSVLKLWPTHIFCNNTEYFGA